MAKYCLDKLHPKKVSYFDYQIEDYFCERAAVKKIDLSCRRAAGDTIFLEVKVVLKTHKYRFLKTFRIGLVSQILNNNNRFYLKLFEFLSRRRYRKCIFQIRLYAIKFQTAVNFSKLSTMRIKAAL